MIKAIFCFKLFIYVELLICLELIICFNQQECQCAWKLCMLFNTSSYHTIKAKEKHYARTDDQQIL